MASWFYQIRSDVVGPVSWEELQQKADEGEIAPQTPVRDGPSGDWQPASLVDGLFLAPAGPIDSLGIEGGETGIAEAEGGRKPPDEAPAEAAPGGARSPLALRPCGDCGRMVSHHAAACPNCGRSFRDASATIPYRGEHPVPVWVFFTFLALAFALASPAVVHRLAAHAAASALADETAAGAIAVLAAAVYAFSMICCALLGGAVGAPRMAYYTGLLLGLFFGPLGVFAAFAIDKRPQCPNCLSRLGGLARECPYCHARLIWAKEVRWY